MGSRLLRGGGDFAVKITFTHTYENIISVENLLSAWQEFIRGKRKKRDVQEFQYNLMSNIITLRNDLKEKTYHHGGYTHFKISDPKQRDIHKASVCDRLVHHAIYRILYPYFDTQFIHDSYSCRNKKGTHKAMNRFRDYAYTVSKNHTKTIHVLKCDIRKFFASVDQSILMSILEKHINDTNILLLLQEVIQSFNTHQSKGLPLGNLTSQLLVNIYMNEFDQYVKHTLKEVHYIRYADDFVFLSQDKKHLEEILQSIGVFLAQKLKLTVHPDKVSIVTFSSGVDFLGWVHFKTNRVLRTTSKRRMWRRLENATKLDCFVATRKDSCVYKEMVVQSYLGLLSHGDTFKLRKRIPCVNF